MFVFFYFLRYDLQSNQSFFIIRSMIIEKHFDQIQAKGRVFLFDG